MSTTTANPHPYPIKTTTTGILTRSNSSHSTTSPHHHYVPPSPSKPKPRDEPKVAGHRYTRSLNGELPRPLPVPPDFFYAPSSQAVSSPTKSEFLDDIHTPNPPAGPWKELGLPDDVRNWSPDELCMYLTSNGNGQEIVDFVRREGINGRKFLRLNERDVVRYGLNERWQSVLFSTSRALRHRSIRGRLWRDGDREQDDDELYSSSSSVSSVASTSSKLSVKGIVASLERNGPRSTSPDKQRSRSISPVKRTFNDEAKEPRLLPYPPTPPIAQGIPAHSPFPSGVLPFSPQPTGVASPQSQTQILDGFYPGSLTDGVRPLPLPPHAGQFYQPLMQGYGGVTEGYTPSVPVVLSDEGYMAGPMVPMPMPHGAEVPHVHVDPPQTEHSSHPQQQHQQQQQPQVFMPIPIHAPAPRSGSGSDSPTKLLEAKLEELLEPKPRASPTLGPGIPGSRPRSRVPSLNMGLRPLNDAVAPGPGPITTHGSLIKSRKEGSGSGDLGAISDPNNGLSPPSQMTVPRKRVISTSLNKHAHRLSGVEAWGESHRHAILPPDDGLPMPHGPRQPSIRSLHELVDSDMKVDDPKMDMPTEVEGQLEVKEREGEEEAGIEAVLEQEGLTLPLSLNAAIDDFTNRSGHQKEGSTKTMASFESASPASISLGSATSTGSPGSALTTGSGSGTFGSHSRVSSFAMEYAEPKSSVIMVVEKKGSSSLRSRKQKDRGQIQEMEGEHTVEELLAKEGILDEARMKKPADGVGDHQRKEKQRVSGAKAWEVVCGETVKRVGEEGSMKVREKNAEDIFGRIPVGHTPGSLAGDEMNRQVHKDKIMSEIEERERRLEKDMQETRNMVMELKGKVEGFENWIQAYEKERETKQERENQSQMFIFDIMRRIFAKSNWFTPSYSTKTSTTSDQNSSTSARCNMDKTVAMIRRFTIFGLNLSTYAVLFSIGVCFALLKVLRSRVGNLAGGVGRVGLGLNLERLGLGGRK